MNQALARLWAKTSRDNDGRWHPLILHMLDVAASAEAILTREPESTRTRMAAVLGLEWEQARPWLLFLIACHDLGKGVPRASGDEPNDTTGETSRGACSPREW